MMKYWFEFVFSWFEMCRKYRKQWWRRRREGTWMKWDCLWHNIHIVSRCLIPHLAPSNTLSVIRIYLITNYWVTVVWLQLAILNNSNVVSKKGQLDKKKLCFNFNLGGKKLSPHKAPLLTVNVDWEHMALPLVASTAGTSCRWDQGSLTTSSSVSNIFCSVVKLLVDAWVASP